MHGREASGIGLLPGIINEPPSFFFHSALLCSLFDQLSNFRRKFAILLLILSPEWAINLSCSCLHGLRMENEMYILIAWGSGKVWARKYVSHSIKFKIFKDFKLWCKYEFTYLWISFIYDNKYVLSKVLTDFSVLFPIISSNHNLAIEFVSYLRQTSWNTSLATLEHPWTY